MEKINSSDKNYKSSGVDLSFSNNLTEKILSIVGKNNKSEDLGFFSSSLKIDNNVIVSGSVDGVGTKSKIFKFYGNYANLGYDIVNHCVNDILPSGAKPFMFLDYLAFSEIDEKNLLNVVIDMERIWKKLDTRKKTKFKLHQDFDVRDQIKCTNYARKKKYYVPI